MQNLNNAPQSRPQANQLYGQKTPQKQKIFYDCQCGKRYDAFPGLYLHFKRKHNIKISSHPSPQSYKMRTNSICQVITYFYTKPRTSQEKNSVSESEAFYCKFKLIVEEFYKGQKNQKIDKSLSLIALDKFCLFLCSNITKIEGDQQEEFFNNIPQGLNGFFMKEIEGGFLTAHNYRQWRYTLLLFSQWLHKKGYTEYTVTQNQEFSLEQQ